MSYVRWKKARYAVPAAVLAAVGLGALVPTLSGASAPPDLPAQTAQQLVADLAAAKTPQLSGALTWTANLGLSDLSSLEQESGQSGGNGNGFDPLTLLSGNYHLDVWLGTKAEHIALIEPSDQEVDIVRNNNQAWIWDSSTQNVLHLIGANPASKSSASTGVGVGSGLSALPLTPMELASHLLGHLNTSTAVSVGSPVYVAGHPAYQLVVGPKGAAGSSIRNIEVALGASGPLLGVPLQIAIYTKGQATPALELGFTGELNTGAPPTSKLTFTAPPGSTMVTRTVGAGSSGSALGASIPLIPLTKTYGAAGTVPSPGVPPALGSGLGKLSKSGTGWSTVVSGSSGPLLGSIAAGPLSAVTRVVTVHGQQGRLFSTELLNVLIMQNGHYYAGFVTPSVLEAAASASS